MHETRVSNGRRCRCRYPGRRPAGSRPARRRTDQPATRRGGARRGGRSRGSDLRSELQAHRQPHAAGEREGVFALRGPQVPDARAVGRHPPAFRQLGRRVHDRYPFLAGADLPHRPRRGSHLHHGLAGPPAAAARFRRPQRPRRGPRPDHRGLQRQPGADGRQYCPALEPDDQGGRRRGGCGGDRTDRRAGDQQPARRC